MWTFSVETLFNVRNILMRRWCFSIVSFAGILAIYWEHPKSKQVGNIFYLLTVTLLLHTMTEFANDTACHVVFRASSLLPQLRRRTCRRRAHLEKKPQTLKQNPVSYCKSVHQCIFWKFVDNQTVNWNFGRSNWQILFSSEHNY